MHTSPVTNPYKHHRFSAEIISQCVCLYFRLYLSYRDVEEPMAERGIILTYAAVPYWCRTFGGAMPINCAAGIPDLGTSGTLMRCF
jgi:transposase-like protein